MSVQTMDDIRELAQQLRVELDPVQHLRWLRPSDVEYVGR